MTELKMESEQEQNAMFIGLLGKMGSGKSTTAAHITKKYNYEEKFYSKKLKDVCQLLFGFNEEQLYGSKKQEIDKRWGISPRQAMQFVGTDLFRKQLVNLIPGIGENFWIRTLDTELINGQNYVISDCRMQNEIDFIKKKGGVVIKIIRDEEEEINNNETKLHVTECEIDNVTEFDYIIHNNGTKEELFKKIDEFMDLLTISIV